MRLRRGLGTALLLLTLFNPLSWAGTSISKDVSRDTALAKFVKANFEYKDGHYEAAIKLYEEVLTAGLASGPLYYNLANSYFKKGALGKTILNYERARRLLPRDHDLRANQRYAASLIQNQVVENPPALGQRALEQFVEFQTLDELAMIMFVLGLLVGATVLLSLHFSWNTSLRNRILIPFSILFLIYSSGFFYQRSHQRDVAVVIAPTAVKFEPRPEATTYFDLSEGQEIMVLRTEGVWAKIRRGDGKEGWVEAANIERI